MSRIACARVRSIDIFSIFLIEKTGHESAKDVTISIKPSAEKGILEASVEGGGTDRKHTMLLDNYDMEDYLATLIKSIILDTAGCEEIQVCSPGFQSVIFKVSQLKEEPTLTTILFMARFASRSWTIKAWAQQTQTREASSLEPL